MLVEGRAFSCLELATLALHREREHTAQQDLNRKSATRGKMAGLARGDLRLLGRKRLIVKGDMAFRRFYS